MQLAGWSRALIVIRRLLANTIESRLTLLWLDCATHQLWTWRVGTCSMQVTRSDYLSVDVGQSFWTECCGRDSCGWWV
jgi:hypothetical protein